MKKLLTVYISLLLHTEIAKSQVYATAESIGLDSSCVGCVVVNSQNSVDGSLTSYSQIDLPHNLSDSINAFIYQNLDFSSQGVAGEMVSIIVQSMDSIPLDSVTLSGVDISTLNGGLSNFDTISSAQFQISLLNGSTSKYIIKFQATNNFDAVQVLLKEDDPGSIDNLNIFYAMRTDLALPVELIYFDGSPATNSIHLSWATATETNNDFFTLESSANGVNFYSLGIIKGSGNSLMEKKYSFTDTRPQEGTNYYRLKQTDYNGKFKYYKIISFEYTETEPELSISPNPLSFQDLQINFKLNEDATLTIISANGELILSKNFPMDQTGQERSFRFTDILSNGMYYVKLIGTDNIKVKKLTVTSK